MLAPYRKAIAAAISSGILGGIAALVTALGDGKMTAQEWGIVALSVVGAALGGGGVTYAAPANAPTE